METVTAGNQYSGEPLLLLGLQSPDLGSVGRVAVAPGELFTHVPALWPTPTGGSLLQNLGEIPVLLL